MAFGWLFDNEGGNFGIASAFSSIAWESECETFGCAAVSVDLAKKGRSV